MSWNNEKQTWPADPWDDKPATEPVKLPKDKRQ